MTNNVQSIWCQADESTRVQHLERFTQRKRAEQATVAARRERRAEFWSFAWDVFWWGLVASLVAAGLGSYAAHFKAFAATVM